MYKNIALLTLLTLAFSFSFSQEITDAQELVAFKKQSAEFKSAIHKGFFSKAILLKDPLEATMRKEMEQIQKEIETLTASQTEKEKKKKAKKEEEAKTPSLINWKEF